MTVQATTLAHRNFAETDEAEVLSLLSASLAGGPAGALTSSFFRWKHLDNPFGTSPGLVALDDDRIVGVRLFLRWKLEAAGRLFHAVRAVDTATHPDYLRRGIFRELTLSLLADLEKTEQVDLVFNTPNADSRPGYLRMGWQEVGVLPVHVAPVRWTRFLRGMTSANRANASGGAAAVATSASDTSPRASSSLPDAASAFTDRESLDDLIRQRPSTVRLRTALSVDYLHWRYVDAPGLDYRCVPVERNGRLVGVGFGRLRRRAGLTEFTLGDVLVERGDPRIVRAVLRAARRSGADHVTAHLSGAAGSGPAAVLTGYLPVPNNGIRLVANPRGRTSTSVLNPAGWQLSLGDLEVF